MTPSTFIPSVPLPLHPYRSPTSPQRPRSPALHLQPADATDSPVPSSSSYDIVVIGAGLGGLSAAALLSSTYNQSVCVLEAHVSPGGAAHSFTRRTPRGAFTFHAGPHLFSGLSSGGSSSTSFNPLQHILKATDTPLPVVPYTTWGVLLPDNIYVPTKITPSTPLFSALIENVSGPVAARQVTDLLAAMKPLCRAATALPPAAIRPNDPLGTLRVASRFLGPRLLPLLPHFPKLTGPFQPILHKYVKDPFARNFLNLLCFLLAGVTAERIPTAEVAFMFAEWMGETAGDGTGYVLEHPAGGAEAIANALVDTIQRSATSHVRVRSRVQRILFEPKKSRKGRLAVGVQLTNGQVVYARRGVVANVSAWDLPKLLHDTKMENSLPKPPEMCPSFMHLHLAVELTKEVQQQLPHKLEINYASVEDWGKRVDDPDNVVLVTIPSVAEPDKFPDGFAVVHAYTPATEPYERWRGLEPGSEEYDKLKKERSAVLWRAVNRIFGQDVRKIAHVCMVGTPVTHSRFLNRANGTYGPVVDARLGGLGLPFPRRKEIADGLYTVGDCTFPGIGVPAVAASGWLVANSFASVKEHARLLHKIGL